MPQKKPPQGWSDPWEALIATDFLGKRFIIRPDHRIQRQKSLAKDCLPHIQI
jgi:hypothetical protein